MRINRKQHHHHRRRGYSLIEVMIAATLTSIVVAFTSASLSFGFGLVAVSRENLRAAQILQEKMETIRLYNWEQLNTPGFVPDEFTAPAHPAETDPDKWLYEGTITITDAPIAESYESEMRMVTVELRWVSGTAERRREMTTFVARDGLQNYIW